MKASESKKSKTAASAKQNLLRLIPQVDEVLQWLTDVIDAPMFLIKQSVREELELLRQNILSDRKVNKSGKNSQIMHPVSGFSSQDGKRQKNDLQPLHGIGP